VRTDARARWSAARLAGRVLLMPAVAAPALRSRRQTCLGRVTTAQACSWVGDIALLGRSRGPFLTGVTAFLLAHVAYISAFRARSSQRVLATRGRRRLLAAGATTATAMALAAARKDRALAAPVAGYGVALSAMVAAAAAVDPARGRSEVLRGASLFLVSDALIGVRKFLADDRGRGLEAAIATTYATGQWLIARGLRGGESG
jgi:uncharacterized membrane protein YhhN